MQLESWVYNLWSEMRFSVIWWRQLAKIPGTFEQ